MLVIKKLTHFVKKKRSSHMIQVYNHPLLKTLNIAFQNSTQHFPSFTLFLSLCGKRSFVSLFSRRFGTSLSFSLLLSLFFAALLYRFFLQVQILTLCSSPSRFLQRRENVGHFQFQGKNSDGAANPKEM